MAAEWTVAAPYPEGAVMQLVRELDGRGDLGRLFMPSRRASRALTGLAARSGGSVLRRVRAGATDQPQLTEVAPVLEGLRLLARLGIGPGGATDPMRAVRRPFDRAVSRRVGPGGADVFVGMPGTSEASFRTRSDALRVLHQVDGHAHVRNVALDAHFGRDAARERVPRDLAGRIDREIHMAEVVLVPSHFVRQQLTKAGVDDAKILCVPYGVDTSRFAAHATARTEGRRRLLYVGQVSYRKGVPILVNAVRGMDLELDLVGPVVAPSLLRGLPENVRHRSTVAHTELTELFAQADAFVIPSVEDAFGLVVPEALASGLPVITTAFVGAAEIMRARDGVVLPEVEHMSLRGALDAVVPLLPDERTRRADEFRTRVDSGDVHDWPSYTAAVIGGVEARLLEALMRRNR